MNSGEKEHNITKLQTATEIPQIVDYRVTMLIAAGALKQQAAAEGICA